MKPKAGMDRAGKFEAEGGMRTRCGWETMAMGIGIGTGTGMGTGMGVGVAEGSAEARREGSNRTR